MTKNRSLVRASDIGAWTFCHRSWWLAQVKGVPHRNPARLQQGRATHETHGRTVVRANRLRNAGLLLVSGGLMLAVLVLLFWLWTG